MPDSCRRSTRIVMKSLSGALASLVLLACGTDRHGFQGEGDPDAAAPADGGGSSGTFDGSQSGPDGGGTASACKGWISRGYEAGPDAVLGTADDVFAPGREVGEVDVVKNVISRQTTYGGPGPDGV